MIRVQRILFATDFSNCAKQAMEHALYLASKASAELHMLHAIVLHEDDPHNAAAHLTDLADVQRQLEKLATEEMKAELGTRKPKEVRVTMAQERGISASQVILDYANGNAIDLIVMGTHGRQGLGHFFLGSVAEKVVRLAHCPVLTIREREEPIAIEQVERILLPIDFSEHSKVALRHGREIAAAYGARLQLLHVVEKPLNPPFYGAAVVELTPEMEGKAKRAMEELEADVAGPKVDSEIHVIEGRAARDIVDFAERHDSDLIVIGTHGLTGLQHLLLGSATEKVVRTAPCPVFTVKSFGRSLVE